MTLSNPIHQALKEAGEWLVNLRQTGSWQDMVYKAQGILNTCEAWRTLLAIHAILPEVKWSKTWMKEDGTRLAQEAKIQGFVRTPYCPSNRCHESVDAAAFLLLTLPSLFKQGERTPKLPPSLEKLTRMAEEWLLDQQSSAGGWSWGEPRQGRPLYAYFTYMALGALRARKDVDAKRASQAVQTAQVEQALQRGEAWLIEAQRTDGSFGVHSSSDAPDIASTAYAILALSSDRLSESLEPEAQAALFRAVRFLLSTSLTELTQVGRLKLVEAKQPPQLGVTYENYAVPADVLLALVKARCLLERHSLEGHSKEAMLPQLDDRIQFLAHSLLEQKEPGQGWPRSYSAIYVTHTSVEALVAYLQFRQSQPQGEKTEREPSAHYNPYVFGFPIHHPSLFFGRDQEFQRIRADVNPSPSAKRDVAIIGEPHIGKTSLLYQLSTHLQQEGHVCFYLDLQLMQSVPQFLQTFIAELGQAVFGMAHRGNLKMRFVRAMHTLDRKLFHELEIELQTPFLSVSRAETTEDVFKAFLSDVAQLLEQFRRWRGENQSKESQPNEESQPKLLVLLDEIGALQAFQETRLYHLLRGLAQQTPDLALIVSGTPEDYASIETAAPEFSHLFTPIVLGPLEPQAARQLITQPVAGKLRYTSDAIERLLEISKGVPSTLQALGYHCVRSLAASQTQITTPIVEQALEAWRHPHSEELVQPKSKSGSKSKQGNEPRIEAELGTKIRPRTVTKPKPRKGSARARRASTR